ncbi:SprT family protein [Agrilactobacillus yilanensis]|uniref:SprT family protein n=1 Tax=Agrilactobacillus yilanensis TaxID=2485997 RepID=A0ABW4JB86_9LACO|nr:SprT family protein [Agrilactobacillus yilanensis]
MTDEDLTQLVQQVSQQYFQKPFLHQAVFNNRLQTTGGRYHLQDHHIDINPKLLQYYDQTVLVGVIKHELCHYHLHLLGLPYQHRSVQFKQLLSEVKGLVYTPPMPKKGQKLVVYQCQRCLTPYYRQRRLNPERYRCRKCGGQLVFLKVIQKIN